MNKYENGIIYKIFNDNNCYYGSSTESLSNRLCKHLNMYKLYKQNKHNYVSSFIIFDEEGYKIEKVEDYPCKTKKELLLREGYYIRNNKCVNIKIAGRTKSEYNKLWKSQNKEKVKIIKKKSDKKYYEKNKIKILEKQKTEKYTCECGSTLRKCAKAEHEKSDKHKYFIKNGEPMKIIKNPLITCECGAIIKKYVLNRHKQSKKHLNNLNKLF